MKDNFNSFSKEIRFEDFSSAVQHCSLCLRLCNRTKVLSRANGNLESKVLFVAEAPGRLGADRTGIPLYGDKTGDNFERLLGNIGWERKNIFITNAILCNPRDDNGNNSTPTLEEIKNCSCYLEMTVNLIQPDVIVSLGRIALDALSFIMPHTVKLNGDTGKPFDWYGRKLIPLYHPGPRAVIHRSLIKQRSDFMALAKFVDPLRGIIQKKRIKIKQSRTPELVVTNNFNQLIYAIMLSFKQLTYFKLTKLLYLIDMKAIQELGHSVSGEIYLRQQEGPWPPALRKSIPLLNGHEIIYSYRKNIPIVNLGPSSRIDYKFDDVSLAIIIETIQKYGHMTNAEIKNAVYMTPAMKYILKQEKLGKCMKNIAVIYKDKLAGQEQIT